MDQINNEKVGSYISELRKAKKLTQKDLADKLYVSDKTVSKWERGVSMPSIPLLMPLANLFDFTVTELLKGEHQNIESLKPCDIHAYDHVIYHTLQRHRKHWIIAYFLCIIIFFFEIIMFTMADISLSDLKSSITTSVIILLLGGYFCFLTPKVLPSYYDSNKIHYVMHGIFRIHCTGLSFHNGNWPYICTTIKSWALLSADVFILIHGICIKLYGSTVTSNIQGVLLTFLFCSLILAIYYIGKKYE